MASQLGLGPQVISWRPDHFHSPTVPVYLRVKGPMWPHPSPSVASAVSAVTPPISSLGLAARLPLPQGFQGRGSLAWKEADTQKSEHKTVSSTCSMPLSPCLSQAGSLLPGPWPPAHCCLEPRHRRVLRADTNAILRSEIAGPRDPPVQVWTTLERPLFAPVGNPSGLDCRGTGRSLPNRADLQASSTFSDRIPDLSAPSSLLPCPGQRR